MNIPLFTELLAAELCADNAESGEWAEAYAYASKDSQERSRPAVYLGQTVSDEHIVPVSPLQLPAPDPDEVRLVAHASGEMIASMGSQT